MKLITIIMIILYKCMHDYGIEFACACMHGLKYMLCTAD